MNLTPLSVIYQTYLYIFYQRVINLNIFVNLFFRILHYVLEDPAQHGSQHESCNFSDYYQTSQRAEDAKLAAQEATAALLREQANALLPRVTAAHTNNSVDGEERGNSRDI